MKRMVSLLLSLCLAALLLTACGENAADQPNGPASAEEASEISTDSPQGEASEGAESPATAEGTSEASETEPVETTADEAVSYGALCFESNGFTFGILDEVDAVLEALGDPVSTFEADSCAYQGKDYFYYYDGFEFCGNVINDVNVVISITVDDDTVKLPQGITIGTEIGEALTAVNESLGGSDSDLRYTESGSLYKFISGPCCLMIQKGSDDCVKAIQFVQADAE